MSGTAYLQTLIAQLADGPTTTKVAAEDEDKKGDKKKSDSKDDDKKGGRAFFEKMRGKKDDDKKKSDDKDKDEKEKKANQDAVLAMIADLPDDLKKLAAAQAESEFLLELAQMNAGLTVQKQASAQAPALDERVLFNAAYEEHTAKLAALDPEYGAALDAQQEKMAFNQGFNDTLAAIKAGVNPFAAFAGQ
jgi:hypothetical protein